MSQLRPRGEILCRLDHRAHVRDRRGEDDAARLRPRFGDGAKLAHPDKLCINVWGDGAIGVTGLDIETAARYDIPILSVLLNNFEMAGYETPFGGDFDRVADALGAYSERIEDPDEIASAIERGVEKTEAGTPVLLEFITAKETELSRPDLD